MRPLLSASLAAVVLLPTGTWRCEPSPPRVGTDVAAITTEDTAVFLPAVGPSVELHAGGPGTARLHSVDVSADGRRAWVTECCEPVWGQWWEIDVGAGPIDPLPRPGYGFDLDDEGTTIASLGFYEVAVRDVHGTVIVAADLMPFDRDPWDLAWVAPDRLAVIELARTDDDGLEFRLVTTDSRLTSYETATGALIASGIDRPWPRLAGTDEAGRILVLRPDPRDEATRYLEAYDGATLTRALSADVELPGRATWAWVEAGHVLWIDRHERLHVDGERVPGRYTWARPTGQ